MSRSLSQWVDYIQTLHARTIDLGLERVAEVWDRFKPATLPPVIAVAGTNGKGSSISMLEAVYRQAGYHTASFTSPHLLRFNERICLNNIPVDDARLLASFEYIEAMRGKVPLTFFEFNTLLALDLFCRAKPDVILLEVGLGGRLDAVNVINNKMALITSIGIDHTAWLGDSREQIALEKAGIIKASAKAVFADPDIPGSAISIAKAKQAEFIQAGVEYSLKKERQGARIFMSAHPRLKVFNGLKLEPALAHVQNNRAGVVATIAMLNNDLPVSQSQLRAGLDKQLLPGRLQFIKGKPSCLLDVSHNEASVLAMLDYVDTLKLKGQIHAVFGALADKNYGLAYEALKARITHWYFCDLDGERGQSAKALSDKLFAGALQVDERLQIGLYSTPELAFVAAKSNADCNDLVLIFGSFYLVGAIIPVLTA
jgi:dihydrofolate synthase/folylpolyglutamate synthase